MLLLAACGGGEELAERDVDTEETDESLEAGDSPDETTTTVATTTTQTPATSSTTEAVAEEEPEETTTSTTAAVSTTTEPPATTESTSAPTTPEAAAAPASVPPEPEPEPEPAAPNGSALYASRCSSCHGGSGQGSSSVNIQGTPEGRTQNATINGRSQMPAFPDLSAAEVAAIAAHVAGL